MSEPSEDEAKRRAYAVCLEMLAQRRYTVTERADRHIVADKPDGTRMAVFFSDVEKYRSQTNKEYISLMCEMDITHCIIVYNVSVTAPTHKDIAHMKDLRIELFPIDDLQYNITTHRLQPVFEQLSESEARFHKKKFGTKFPVLLQDDPVARFYGYRRGDIVRVIRDKGAHIAYRIVR